MALGLGLLNPAYVAPYRTVTGQVVLAVVVAVFAVGFGWLQRLSRTPAAGRFLSVRTRLVPPPAAPSAAEAAR